MYCNRREGIAIAGEIIMQRSYAMKSKLIITVTVALATFVLGGCASTPWGNGRASTSASASEIESQKADLARREEALAQQQSQLDAERVRLADARNELQSESAAAQTSGTGNASGLIPPDPKPGECYARVIIPAKYETVSERVLKREASERIEIIPARYEIVEETRVVKEAATKLEVIPAQYETIQERVLVKPAATKLEVIPAIYETIEERILVKAATTQTIEIPAVYKYVKERVLAQPARNEWKRVTDIGSGIAVSGATQMTQRFGDYKVLETRVEDTGDLMCLVEIPATYKEIEKQVLARPASTRTVESSPAEYKTVKKTVLKAPATTREVPIPAKYRMVEVTREISPETTRELAIPAVYGSVSVTKLVEPTSERRIPIAAEYTTVTRNNKISDERSKWRPVLCEVNMTRENVSALQAALNETGSCRCGPNRNVCQVDGIIGQCTLKAAQHFAERKGLSSGNKYVTMDVIRALGLKF